MDWKAKFQDVLGDLERERDELRVRAHLARAEAKDELARLEQKLDELRFRAGAGETKVLLHVPHGLLVAVAARLESQVHENAMAAPKRRRKSRRPPRRLPAKPLQKRSAQRQRRRLPPVRQQSKPQLKKLPQKKRPPKKQRPRHPPRRNLHRADPSLPRCR